MQKVVVVGGGYGGLRFIESLAPSKTAQLTLLDKNPYHYLQTEAYEFLSGRKNVCDITFNLRSFCSYFDNVDFIKDEAVALKDGMVVGKKGSYPFDTLIIAAGAVDFFPTPQIARFSPRLKELAGAFGFKQNFLKALFKEVAFEKGARIVVAGAGLSGVELAADFASVVKECGTEVGQKSLIEVCLVEAKDKLLPQSSPFLQMATRQRLEELGVKIYLNSPIERIEEGRVYIKGFALEYDLFIFAGGILAADFVRNLPFEKNSLGQLEVDGHLRVKENIFAIGDCAAIKDDRGRLLPPTAQIAEQSAEYVAKFISKGIKSPFRGKIYGTFIALGDNYAVGELFGFIRIKGLAAALIKKLIEKIYAFGIRLKVNSGYKKRL